MKYHFKMYSADKGYWASCVELEGCHSQGDSREELEANAVEALNLYLSEPTHSGHIFPKPKRGLVGRNILNVPVYPSVAFANRLREFRLKCKLTQIEMKTQLGIKNLSNYQRLEDPTRANPEWKTLFKIKKHFPNFRIEDLLAT